MQHWGDCGETVEAAGRMGNRWQEEGIKGKGFLPGKRLKSDLVADVLTATFTGEGQMGGLALASQTAQDPLGQLQSAGTGGIAKILFWDPSWQAWGVPCF